jgi:hypothetical protein
MTYYPVWIAVGGRDVIRRGPDCTTAKAAVAVVQEKIADGHASMGVVVEVDDHGDRRVKVSWTKPAAARKVIEHYEDILDYISL